LKYGYGMPFHRQETLQGNLGIPLSDATQWDIVNAQAERAEPIWKELVRQAAQGDVIHNDDTGVKILELMRERARQAALEEETADDTAEDSAKEPGPQRTGMFTTGIVATGDGHKIALFLSGHQHAGENLKDVLRRRAAELPSPIQMCDALCAPDVSGWTPKGGHPEHLVGNVVGPWPFGRPPWLGVTLMKCVIHRQDSYPDNVGHWRCSVALAVPLTKVSARLREEPTNTFGKSQSHSRQYQSRPEIDAGIGNVLNGRKQC
jgi:hypothetical protein